MKVVDLKEGMTVDLTIRGAIVKEVDQVPRRHGETHTLALLKMPGNPRETQSVWLRVENRIYGGDGVELDAAYMKEPLGRSIARDRSGVVWQRDGSVDGDGTWYCPNFSSWLESGALGWRSLWKEHGPLEVLMDDTVNEPKRAQEEIVDRDATTIVDNEHNPA
jgi:hypothetical protein